jgi:hypothetical protein
MLTTKHSVTIIQSADERPVRRSKDSSADDQSILLLPRGGGAGMCMCMLLHLITFVIIFIEIFYITVLLFSVMIPCFFLSLKTYHDRSRLGRGT